MRFKDSFTPSEVDGESLFFDDGLWISLWKISKNHLSLIFVAVWPSSFRPVMVELYWNERESESDIAHNGCIVFLVVCLYWIAAEIKESFCFRVRFNIIPPLVQRSLFTTAQDLWLPIACSVVIRHDWGMIMYSILSTLFERTWFSMTLSLPNTNFWMTLPSRMRQQYAMLIMVYNRKRYTNTFDNSSCVCHSVHRERQVRKDHNRKDVVRKDWNLPLPPRTQGNVECMPHTGRHSCLPSISASGLFTSTIFC